MRKIKEWWTQRRLIYIKLTVLCVIFFFINFLVDYLFGLWIEDFPQHWVYIIGCLPLILYLLFFLQLWLRGKNTLYHLGSHKYSLFFPVWFCNDEHPTRNSNIDIEKIKRVAESGDVILRRYKNHLDNLVFGENSYYTHVGIYCKPNGEDEPYIMHCTLEKGLNRESVDDFCNCDEVALMRFSLDPTEEEENIAAYIDNPHRYNSPDIQPHLEEKQIFDTVINKVKQELIATALDEKLFPERLNDVIMKRAVSFEKLEYDSHYDFDNFDKMSCVEYVWYCYKCLFPLHRIRVKDFEFFNLIELPVIIPDVFVKNDYFRYAYCSNPELHNKINLVRKVRKHKGHFWRFLLSILVFNVVLMFIAYCIYKRTQH